MMQILNIKGKFIYVYRGDDFYNCRQIQIVSKNDNERYKYDLERTKPIS